MEETYYFSKKELDLIRQWFNCVEDLNPKYLLHDDFVLYEKIIKHLKDVTA
jgi:coproporphyrinogen III oxidase